MKFYFLNKPDSSDPTNHFWAVGFMFKQFRWHYVFVNPFSRWIDFKIRRKLLK